MLLRFADVGHQIRHRFTIIPWGEKMKLLSLSGSGTWQFLPAGETPPLGGGTKMQDGSAFTSGRGYFKSVVHLCQTCNQWGRSQKPVISMYGQISNLEGFSPAARPSEGLGIPTDWRIFVHVRFGIVSPKTNLRQS